MSVTVGTVSFNLEAGVAEFIGDMGQAKEFAARTANDIKRSFEQIKAAAATLLAGEGAHALLEMGNASIEAMAKMGSMASAAGTSTQMMSQIGVAARLTSTPVDEVGKGMEKLAKSALAAETGNRGLSNIFSKLGVDVRNGSGGLKDSGIILLDVAQKLEKYRDDAGKTAVLQQLFGKSGAAMNPVLHEMAQHWTEVTDAAGKFGIVLNSQTAEAAERTQQGLVKLKLAGEGAFQALMAAALPSLEKLTTQMEQWAEKTDLASKVQAFGPTLVHGIELVGEAFQFCVDHAHGLKVALEALAGLEAFRLFGPFAMQLAAADNPMKLLTSGTLKFIQSALGIRGVTKELMAVGLAIKETAQFSVLLAQEEGVASAASYALTAALSSTLVPLAAVAAAGGIVAYALYDAKQKAAALSGVDTSWMDVWNAGLEQLSLRAKQFSLEWQSLKAFVVHGDGPLAGYFMREAAAMSDAMPTFQQQIAKMAQARDAVQKAAAAAAANNAKPAADNKQSFGTAGLSTQQSAQSMVDAKVQQIQQQTRAQEALTAAVGKYGDALIQVNALNEADKQITELNIELKKRGLGVLTSSQQAQIHNAELAKAGAQTQAEFSKSLEDVTHAAQMQTQSSLLMAGAASLGSRAMREAEISAKILAVTYGWSAEQIEKYTPELNKMAESMRNAAAAAAAAKNEQETFDMEQQISDQLRMNKAILAGRDAVEQLTAQFRVEALERKLAQTSDPVEIASIERQIAAQQQFNDTKRQEVLINEALKLRGPVVVYEETKRRLDLCVEALRQALGGQLSYDTEMMIAAQKQRDFQGAVKGTVDMLLQQNSLGAGAAAFFLGFVNEAQTAAQQVKDILSKTFDGLEDTLAHGIIHGKMAKSFQDMFNSLGETMLKQGLHTGMAGIMGAMGLGSLGKGADGKSEATALWMRLAGVGTLPGMNAAGAGDGSGSPLAGLMGGMGSFGGFLKSIFGGMFGGFMAGGGAIDSSKFYIAGENGPEIVAGVNGRIHNASATRSMLGGSPQYTIYADGAEAAEVERRVYRALYQVHREAPTQSAAAIQERQRRMPRSYAMGRA